MFDAKINFWFALIIFTLSQWCNIRRCIFLGATQNPNWIWIFLLFDEELLVSLNEYKTENVWQKKNPILRAFLIRF